MVRLAMVSVLMVTLLAGCGQVIVFGHVMGERRESESTTPASRDAAQGDAGGAGEQQSGAGVSQSDAGKSQSGAGVSQSDAGKSQSGASTAASGVTSPPAGNISSSTAVTPAEQRLAAQSPSVTHALKAVNLTVTAEAAAKVTGDASRFTQDALLDAVRNELKARKLLDDQDPHASGTAEIIVDDLATRPTINAVVFGYKMLAGTLEGDIRVTGADGTASTGSRIVAESKLTIAVSGDDKNPLGPLYRRFAVLAADRLAGVASKAQDPTGPPRF